MTDAFREIGSPAVAQAQFAVTKAAAAQAQVTVTKAAALIQGLQDQIAPPENGRILRAEAPDRVELKRFPSHLNRWDSQGVLWMSESLCIDSPLRGLAMPKAGLGDGPANRIGIRRDGVGRRYACRRRAERRGLARKRAQDIASPPQTAWCPNSASWPPGSLR